MSRVSDLFTFFTACPISSEGVSVLTWNPPEHVSDDQAWFSQGVEVQLADSLVVPMIQALASQWPFAWKYCIFKSRKATRDLGVSVDSGWIEPLTLIIFGCGCAQLWGEILRTLFTRHDMIIGLMTQQLRFEGQRWIKCICIYYFCIYKL